MKSSLLLTGSVLLAVLAPARAQDAPALPSDSDTPAPVAEELSDEPAWLGVQVAAAEDGVAVTAVVDDGPAAAAGVQVGDVIRRIGARRIRSREDLTEFLARSAPGERIALKVRRGEQNIEIELDLVARPLADAPRVLPAAPAAPAAPEGALERVAPGEAAAARPADHGYLGVVLGEDEDGVFLSEVLPGGPAAQAGLKRGDRVARIDSSAVDAAADVTEFLAGTKSGDSVRVRVERDGESVRARVTLSGRPTQTADGWSFSPPPPPAATPRAPAPAPEVSAPGGFLGVYLGESDGAVRIDGLVPGGPAERAGLRAGDRIVRFAGRDVASEADVVAEVGRRRAGERVPVVVQRGRDDVRIEVELGARSGGSGAPDVQPLAPPPPPPPPPLPPLPQLRREVPAPASEGAYLGVQLEPTDRGVVIAGVLDGAPAQRAGLRAGDLLLALDGEQIEDYDGLVELLAGKRAGQRVEVRIERDGDRRTLAVELGQRVEPRGAQAPDTRAPETQGADDERPGLLFDGPAPGDIEQVWRRMQVFERRMERRMRALQSGSGTGALIGPLHGRMLAGPELGEVREWIESGRAGGLRELLRSQGVDVDVDAEGRGRLLFIGPDGVREELELDSEGRRERSRRLRSAAPRASEEQREHLGDDVEVDVDVDVDAEGRGEILFVGPDGVRRGFEFHSEGGGEPLLRLRQAPSRAGEDQGELRRERDELRAELDALRAQLAELQRKQELRGDR